MSTLARLQALQFPPRLAGAPSLSPWPGRAHAFLRIEKPAHLPSVEGRGASPHAEARGFGLAAAEKKRSRGEDGGGRREGGNNNDDDDDDDAIPQVVFDRIMQRVVVSVATPMVAGVGLLYVLSLLKEQGLWDVPPWLPFVTTLVFFGTSALGIAYGTLSTSWDPDRVGSVLGLGEVRQNWPELWKDEGDERR